MTAGRAPVVGVPAPPVGDAVEEVVGEVVSHWPGGKQVGNPVAVVEDDGGPWDLVGSDVVGAVEVGAEDVGCVRRVLGGGGGGVYGS
jgi:hypothetical protein